ncbi:MAG: aminoglycoside phosphotransferase family protein [Ardenticatenaceae bacterium]|nr:aminoglycoside phosphotransferase family protein [Ardenticatenaceae bacterium]MCB8986756.1 aminoglycoside phosphotransferase family protein [Ardenticatenaceae bacterium]
MLEKPNLRDESIVACVQANYELSVRQIDFLPLGADVHTAVYRLATPGAVYFLKLRRGAFHDITVTLPKFLSDHGISEVISPLPARNGRLWAQLDDFKVILYPFVEGQNGYETPLTAQQWIALGAVLRRVHTAVLPPALQSQIRREIYSPQGRTAVRQYLALAAHANTFPDAIADEVAALLRAQHSLISDLVDRTDRLAEALQAQPPTFTLCHADLHAGNVHITPDGTFYLVDWDDPILAPKEHDLIVAGSGLMGSWRSPEAEEALFYQGYGAVPLNNHALAYYRYERIIQDIAVYCDELLLSAAGGADRAQSLHYLQSNFLPHNTIALAYQADTTSPPPV